MQYIQLPYMDSPVSIFSVAMAHAMLEADYNKGGILWERPSNRRRNASTGVQLHRMKFSPGMWTVDICNPDESDDAADDEVRDIYLLNVIKLGLPMDDEMRQFIASRYHPNFLKKFSEWSQA